jgi:Fur family transcriptional regulator, ferric uptake regulator
VIRPSARAAVHIISAPASAPPVPLPSVAAAAAAVRDRGLRLSSARRLVLEALFAADGPVTADELAGGLGGRVPCSDLASVYRNLETLEQLGLVHHVHAGHGPGLYALSRGREYVLCERCGDLRAVPPATLAPVREALRETLGYQARFTHFPLVALCGGCAESGTGAPKKRDAGPVI